MFGLVHLQGCQPLFANGFTCAQIMLNKRRCLNSIRNRRATTFKFISWCGRYLKKRIIIYYYLRRVYLKIVIITPFLNVNYYYRTYNIIQLTITYDEFMSLTVKRSRSDVTLKNWFLRARLKILKLSFCFV